MRKVILMMFALSVLITGCGPEPETPAKEKPVPTENETESGKDGSTASPPAVPTSDKGCPAATTIISGLGNRQVPYLVLSPRGKAFGSQQGLLVREFNRTASTMAFQYCLAQACVSDYTPVDSSHITYEKKYFGGWTELTMVQAGGQPAQLPVGTEKRAGYITPPSPNVVCKTPPPLPPPVQTYTAPPPTFPVPENEPDAPPHECKGPDWSKAAGTVVIEKRFQFDPLDQSTAYIALARYIANSLETDIDIEVQKWIDEVDGICARRNRGKNCSAAFDSEPEFETQSGDSGSGSQLYLVYRVKLKEAVAGICE